MITGDPKRMTRHEMRSLYIQTRDTERTRLIYAGVRQLWDAENEGEAIAAEALFNAGVEYARRGGK